MCGIIGITGRVSAADSLLQGLRQLEYRGYDSAGIALNDGGTLNILRAKGKLAALAEVLARAPHSGSCGIGHTRWATHGIPSEVNAHPHATDKVAVVHNGIIENYRELREELIRAGHTFKSQTDSEVVPVLITHYLHDGLSPRDAAMKAFARLQGAYALVVLFADEPDLLIGTRHGAPLSAGYGNGEMYLGSDAIALAHLTQRVAYLEDGDVAVLTSKSLNITDMAGSPVQREIREITGTSGAVARGNYSHYMQKEIYEQPSVVAETLAVYYDPGQERFTLPELDKLAIGSCTRIHLVACGTSFYAALVARYWLEQIARVPVDVDIASEFRYRQPLLDKAGLTIVISQSGETADTLAALRYAKQHQKVLAIVNVPESTIAREANAVLPTYAGPEIGVASTKAFTTQLTVLAALTLRVAEIRGNPADGSLKTALLTVSSILADTLQLDERISAVAKTIMEARDVLYLGRGTSYALAHEGALKLKEISYIHAEAYAAGEMKHGPIALIDESVPVIAIAPPDVLFEKTASNLEEANARGGRIVLISDAKGCAHLSNITAECITMPEAHAFVSPIVYAVPVQLLAYHTAVLKGTDVDQPRNLAKSVTVE